MYKVKLQSFEGPFDLLVYLIESAEMSIYDIEISEITSQYLEILKLMEEYNIEVTQEFMVLASTLIEIKSKMILPRMTIEGELELEEDPRNELVERLLEYKRFKRAAQILEEKEEENLRVYRKPQEDISIYLENPDEYLALDIKSFANAFNLFIQKKQKVEMVRKHYTRIEREKTSMINRISMIIKLVRARRDEAISFKDLIPNKESKYDTVVSFVSILEMAKEKMIDIDQKVNYGEILITAGEGIDENKILDKYKEELKPEKEAK